MIRFVSHIMLIAVVTHLFYSSGFLLDYYVNTNIYKEQCINQDRPELNCDGQCILAQKIAEAYKNRAPDKSQMTIPASMEYLSSVFFVENELYFQIMSFEYGWYSHYNYQPLHEYFQPPRS